MRTGRVGAFVGLLLASQVFAHEQASTLAERVNAIVEADMSARQLVGTSIGVMKNGELLVAKGYGYADVENDVRASEHTVFRIGSMTKQFTAAAIMLLVERGKLDLADDLHKYLPDYPTAGRHVTIEQLLTHTSGIKGYTEMSKFGDVVRTDLTHEQMVALFSGEPFEFEPGARYQYSNSGYYLLGVIIEKLSGQTYQAFLKQNILGPLGLEETFYLDDRPIVKHRAHGYEVTNEQIVNTDYISMELPFAAGALGSSASDLLKWEASLVRGKLPTAASYRRMTTPATLNDGKSTTYGFGLVVGRMSEHRKISHNGAINGFRSQLSYYPDDDLIVVVLSNSGAARPEVVESRIARLVLNLPEIQITDVPVPQAELRKYQGIYNPGRAPLRVAVVKGSLTITGRTFRPVGPHRFVATDDPYQEAWFTVEGEQVLTLTMEREGQRTVAPRVRSE